MVRNLIPDTPDFIRSVTLTRFLLAQIGIKQFIPPFQGPALKRNRLKYTDPRDAKTIHPQTVHIIGF